MSEVSLAVRECALADAEATHALGVTLAIGARPGRLALHGPLGAGKTALVRGLLAGLGHLGRVKSPTYTLVEPYELPALRVTHWDLYRLGSPEELEALGWRDAGHEDELMAIEWPERAGPLLGTVDLDLSLAHAGEGRLARLVARTLRGAQWLAEAFPENDRRTDRPVPPRN
jgi:tRNA threonylcarbamoyladenosine biosynthesis protein TsaE